MKTIGLLGGMSWESTVTYYQTINRMVGERLGALHSAKLLLYSFDFQEIESLQGAGRWPEAGARLAAAARILEAGGAELLAVCSNTMHKVADAIESAVSIPLLHIADATGERIAAAGLRRIGLLGTRFTMEQPFLRARLEERHGLEVRVPPAPDREHVHRIVYEELCRGRVLADSRATCRRITADLADRGCEGVVLGCTEIGLLLRAGDAAVPLFDTAALHAEKAALEALG